MTARGRDDRIGIDGVMRPVLFRGADRQQEQPGAGVDKFSYLRPCEILQQYRRAGKLHSPWVAHRPLMMDEWQPVSGLFFGRSEFVKFRPVRGHLGGVPAFLHSDFLLPPQVAQCLRAA